MQRKWREGRRRKNKKGEKRTALYSLPEMIGTDRSVTDCLKFTD
jgi:hypothetical protein